MMDYRGSVRKPWATFLGVGCVDLWFSDRAAPAKLHDERFHFVLSPFAAFGLTLSSDLRERKDGRPSLSMDKSALRNRN
jgi:hypothetical protein